MMQWLAAAVFMSIMLLCRSHMESTQLLMISFDGFRWDYLQLAAKHNRSTPNFNRLLAEGSTVEPAGTKNVFVTKTFPNHYSLVTGLYEEEHGIIGNNFFDPVFNATFSISSAEELQLRWWNGTKNFTVEPIWVTNEKVTVSSVEPKRASGVYYWPGSEVPGQQPKYFKPYNPSVSFNQRVDTVIQWLTNHEEPVNLALLYYHEPDKTGHAFGPSSPEMLDQIVELDKLLGYLLQQLEKHHIYNSLNLIITSDHGMADVSTSINIGDYVNPDDFDHYGNTPTWSIIPKPGKLEEVYKSLKKIQHLTVYKKEEIPERFHFRNNRRIPPIYIAADVGYRLCITSQTADCNDHGNHGYDNDELSMHPIFIAHGNSFRHNYTGKSFNSVDVYPLICHILDIPPRPNNGSFADIKHILISEQHDDGDGGFSVSPNFLTYVGVFGFVSIISFIWCVGAIRAYCTMRNRAAISWQKLSNNSLTLSDCHNSKPLLVSEEEEDIA